MEEQIRYTSKTCPHKRKLFLSYCIKTYFKSVSLLTSITNLPSGFLHTKQCYI